ncbi:MAG: SH3 domain-containing protein [Sulfurimonas sp.]|nr:SH3 domain-containing protein [Sulfurimonas sp.]
MQYISLILISLIFFGCSAKKDIEIKKVVEKNSIVIEDLIKIPQNIEYYTKKIKENRLYKIQKKYEKSYFSMWNIKKASQSLDNIKWPFKYFKVGNSYGENLLPIEKEFFNEIYRKSNFDEYNSLKKKGLILKYSNIRAMPTDKPILRDPSLAGEGFPFDYLQNSSINANTPIFVSHFSRDKQWAFIVSSFAFGWIKSNEFVFIDDKQVSLWQDAKQIVIIKEGVPLFSTFGEPLFDTRIGMMFALIDEDEDSYTILTVSSYKNNEPLFNKSFISKEIASKEILKLNSNNLNKIIKEVSKTKYGWGGIYEQRDCSSTMMDLFSPFGIYLPRNSSLQANIGKVIDLSVMSDSRKTELIKEKGIPFQTLLYKKGHIVLYVGILNNEVIIYQNVWGIKTKKDNKEGRFIVGKSVFSTLKFGDELKYYDKDSGLLKNIMSMNILTR